MDRRVAIAAALGAAAATFSPAWAKLRPDKSKGGDFKMTNKPCLRCIDVHSHFIPDAYRSAAVAAGHSKPDGMPALPPWSEKLMLETMDRLGIESTFLSISSPGVHFGDDSAARALARSVNTTGAALKTTHPDRFGHFASLPLPDVEGALSELQFVFDHLGSDGIILESNSGGIYPGDPKFEPVFQELDRREAVVLLHPTSPDCPACNPPSVELPRPVLEFMFETARAVTNLLLSGTLTRYPRIKFIIPHAGATIPVLADRIAMVTGILPNLTATTPAEIFAQLGKLYYDMAGAPVPRLLPALQTFADPQRLLYGSDWPFTPEPAVARLRDQLDDYLAGEPTLHKAICRENALALFPRLGAKKRN